MAIVNIHSPEFIESRKVEFCSMPGCDLIHIPNVPLIRKIWTHINEHPEEWTQGTWACKVVTIKSELLRDTLGRFLGTTKEQICRTSFCVAGHAVSLSGHQLVWKTDRYLGSSTSRQSRVYEEAVVQIDDSPVVKLAIPGVAMHELGLVNAEDNLFSGNLTLTDIKRRFTALCKIMDDTL